MAKKMTRERKQLARDRAIQQAAANVGLTAARVEPSAAETAPEAPAVQARAPRGIDFSQEYSRARSDLRRIALLAAGIIVVLVFLSFVI